MSVVKYFIFLIIINQNLIELSAQTPAREIPLFEFYNLNNSSFTNGNLKTGTKKLFIFFDVTCDHCAHSIEALNENIKICENISIYLISLDSKMQINVFLNHYGRDLLNNKNVTLLQDFKNQFISKFGPIKYPSVFLYASNNKLIKYDDQDEYLVGFFKKIQQVNDK